MKKILALAVILSCAVIANAQTDLVSQYNKVLDTVTNTGTKYLILATPYSSFYKTVDVAVTYTKISGTLAGTIAVEYSLDGTNYYTVQQDSVLTVTDGASVTKGWQLKDKSIRYLRVRAIGSGTMSGQIKAKIWARKENI